MAPKTSSPTPSKPRRPGTSAGTAGRFNRSTSSPSSAGRFARPGQSGPKLTTRGAPGLKSRGKGKGKSSSKGGLGGLISALPISALGKQSPAKSSSAGKAKPALALIAAGAGAFFGRKQMQKRNEDDVTPITPVTPVTPVAPTAVNDTVPPVGAPRPLDTPASPDAL